MHTAANPKSLPRLMRVGRRPKLAIISGVSVAMALFAVFGLSVEFIPWHHALQHVMLLGAGISLGAAWTSELAKKEHNQHEA